MVFLLEAVHETICERQGKFVSLAAVAKIDAGRVVNSSLPVFPAKILGSVLFQGGKFAKQFFLRKFSRDAPKHGARVVFDDVAGENTEGGKRTWKRGKNDSGNAESFGECAGVKTSSAAKGDEGEVAGIASPFDGDDANGFFHGRVDDADDAGGEFFERER